MDKLTQLALRARDNAEAMEELIPIVMIKAKGIAKGQLWNATWEDKEDLSQDILYRFLKSLSDFTGKSSFNMWLSKLGKNTQYDNYRKTACVKRTPAPREQADSYIDESFICEELIDLACKDQREAIMYFYEGYTWYEAAEETGLEYECLRSRFKRGIKAIRESWQ